MRVIKTDRVFDIQTLVTQMQLVTEKAEAVIVDALCVGEVEDEGAYQFILVLEYQGARAAVPRIITKELLDELANI